MQNGASDALANNTVLCLIRNVVLREDLCEALEVEGFRPEILQDPSQLYCGVILDIDEADDRHIAEVRALVAGGIPLILIGDDIHSPRAKSLPSAAFFSMALVSETVVDRLRDLLRCRSKDGPATD